MFKLKINHEIVICLVCFRLTYSKFTILDVHAFAGLAAELAALARSPKRMLPSPGSATEWPSVAQALITSPVASQHATILFNLLFIVMIVGLKLNYC